MNDQYNIFKRLKDYEAAPPAELMLRIFNRLDADLKNTGDAVAAGRLSQLQELEIIPPAALYALIEQRIVSSFQLSFLQDIEVAPPTAAYDAIIRKIEKEQQPKNTGGGVWKALYNSRVAAAILLLAVAGWLLYKFIPSPAKPAIETAQKKEPPVVLKTDSLQQPGAVNGSNNTAAIPAKSTGQSKVKAAAPADNTIMSVDDYKFAVLNKDLLAAFTSFDYRRLPSFITDTEKKSFSVRADQYAAVAVSESMTKMIRRMNAYRRNGKLRPRARKARAKLEKWKKADAERFDKSLINNPLDPVDLAEFIFQ